MKCKTCGGTGNIFCMRSHFMSDGLRRERCGICGGTGESSYLNTPEYVRWQAEQRAAMGCDQ
jgi:hypothetical protein